MLTNHSSTNLPITTSAGILNLDHYRYLRSLLPAVPHVIQSLVFTDLNNWECELYVNLLNESDSLKWLADFEEKTTTLWKADKDATTAVSQLDSSRRCHWIMIYRCDPTDSKKDCTAKLEMKIHAQDDLDRGNKQQKYPCHVSINFYHTHVTTTPNSIISMETFKSQDIPSHLKEGFEGYFQESVGSTLNSLTSTVNLSAIKPQQTLLSSPLTHSLATSIHQVVTLKPTEYSIKTENDYIKTENDFIKTEDPLSPVGQHLDGKLLDLTEISEKLERTIEALRSMLKQNATACAAVKHFVDKFDKLKNDQTQLEDALSSFGGQWDWLVAPHEAPPQQQQQQQQQQTAVPTPNQNQNVPSPVNVTLTQVADIQNSAKKKLKKRRKEDEGFNSTPGSQVNSEGPESKRRKRARCGNCPGCLNRDKTQDCRQCRNCLDQKRYGGPGRLKKACIKRQCIVLSQLGSTDSTDKSLYASTEKSSNQTLAVAINQPDSLPVAIKSEPTNQVLATPGTIPVSIPSGANISTSSISSISTLPATSISSLPATTLISWPGGQYPPTFQVQVQQPYQFSFQSQPTTLHNQPASLPQIQYTNQPIATKLQYTNQPMGTIQQLNQAQLDSLASEAARHHGVG